MLFKRSRSTRFKTCCSAVGQAVVRTLLDRLLTSILLDFLIWKWKGLKFTMNRLNLYRIIWILLGYLIIWLLSQIQLHFCTFISITWNSNFEMNVTISEKDLHYMNLNWTFLKSSCSILNSLRSALKMIWKNCRCGLCYCTLANASRCIRHEMVKL